MHACLYMHARACMHIPACACRFMAPEVFRHEQYGLPADVYSFGMILYNLLASEAPWPNSPGAVAAGGRYIAVT